MLFQNTLQLTTIAQLFLSDHSCLGTLFCLQGELKSVDNENNQYIRSLVLEAFKYFKLNEHQYIGQGRTYNSGPSREMNNYSMQCIQKTIKNASTRGFIYI